MTAAVPAQRSTAASIALATVTAGLLAAVVNTVIALVAQAAGADPAVSLGLMPAAYIVLGLVGILIGAIGWTIIRNRAAQPSALLRWLVPAVVLVSIVPNLLLLAAGMGVAGPIALALMHVAVAAVAVPVYRRFLPLPR